MQIFKTKKEAQLYLSKKTLKGFSIGFVPTMGALHEGHLSLIKKAKAKNDIVVASIFVNPTQFNNKTDLENYPKTLEKDINLLESVACDVLFYPTVNEIYANTIASEDFNFGNLGNVMEGAFREGHFNGVATIVKRLFEIITPTRAYFGEKDFQQLKIIKILVAQHKIPVKVIGCPIFREKDGLAMSSRNQLLSKKQRAAAPFIYKVLKKVKKKFKTEDVAKINLWVAKKFKEHAVLELEYFSITNAKTLAEISEKTSVKKHRAFIAVFAGEVRLIDTLKL